MGGGPELVADGGFGSAALVDVAVDTAFEADLVGRLDEDGGMILGAEGCVVEGEDAFDDDDGCGGHGVGGVGDAGVGGEVVTRGLDGAAGGEIFYVSDEEFVFERVGMVKVLAGSLFEGEMGEVVVVEIEGEQGGGEFACEFAGEGGFAGAGTSADAEDEGCAGGGESGGGHL